MRKDQRSPPRSGPARTFRPPHAGGLGLVLGMLAVFAGCGGGGDAKPPAPPAPVTATGVAITDLSGVNELIASDVHFTTDVLDQMFLQLLAEQADFTDHPPTLAPELATSYEWSADRKSVTFRLRTDATWSDGVPITADDVRFTWQAQVSPDVAWSYAHLKEPIADVEVIDPHTVRFHVTADYAYLLLDINEGKILPRHAWGRIPFAEWRERAEEFRENLVTSGPFRLAEWRPGERIVLERNRRYFDPALPALDRVVFRIAPDAATHADLLAAGAIDFVCGISVGDARKLAKTPGVRVLPFDYRQYDYIAWNTRRPPFDDEEIRRAMTLAIDRQALVDSIFAGYARVSNSPIPSNFWGFDRTLVPWPHDPAEARRILAAKGFVDTDGDGIVERGGKPFSFELTTNSSNRMRADAVVMIQEQLRRVGVDAKPRTMEIHTLTEKNLAHEFDATLSGWAVDTTLDIKAYFHSSEADGGYNFGDYRNAEVDRLLDSARRASSPELAKPDLVAIQRIVHREQPYTFLWEPQRICALDEELENVEPNALSAYFNLPEWRRRGAVSAAGASTAGGAEARRD
jgi:peptide/nickel transport system substrate-binding protein